MVTTFAVLVGLMAGGTGKVQIDVTPANAVIQLDGKRVNTRIFSAKAGDHTIKVSSSGYATKSQKVRVNANKTTRVTIRLKRTAAKKTVKKTTVIGRKTVTPKKPARRPIVRKPVKKPVKKPVRRGVKKTVRKTTVKKRTVNNRGTVKTKKKTVTKRTTVNRRPARKTTGRRRAPARGTVRGNRARGGRGGSQSLRPWAILSFVVGGAAITGGYIVNGMAQEKADEFNTSRNRTEKLGLHKDAKDLDTASTVLYGVGATGVALGVLLLAMDPGDRRATVAPLPGGGAMVGYTGSF